MTLQKLGFPYIELQINSGLIVSEKDRPYYFGEHDVLAGIGT